MVKKNRKPKKPETTKIESAEASAEITESVQAGGQNEALLSDPNPLEEAVKVPPDEEHPSGENPLPLVSAEEGISPEDLLDDVRRSLIEEEADKNQIESKWWHRIGKKDKSAEAEKPPVSVEIDLPAISAPANLVENQGQKQEPEEQVDQIDDLIDILIAESEEVVVESTVVPEVEVPSEPEPEIDFEKLKEQAFRPRTPDNEPENDVRSIALEDGEEVFVEVQSQVSDPLEERLRAFENALKPYRWYINIALAFLGVGVAVIAALIMFNIYKQSLPKPVEEVSNLPYPASVSLPGGWSFQLGKGALQDGKWDPRGAEWLEGTEVCRWVALPWSQQLEAVIRTLNPKDPIELVMSNNDKLIYKVYSIRQLSPEEMQELDSNSPCLLLILTQSDSEERWVLTALP